MASESKIAVMAALIGNFLIALAKLAGALVSGSASMFAESAHSFSDVGNQILLLIGIKRSAAPPTDKHPFGTGKAAYFWPLMVAVLLFGVAGAYSLLEGIEKFRHPHKVDDIKLSLVVLAVAFAIEAVTLGVAVQQARKAARADGLTRKEWMRENRDASLLTVLVEDSLALVGLPIAATALILSASTGDGRWDGAGSIMIGLILMGFALFLGGTVRSLILGRSLSDGDLRKLRDILAHDTAVEEVRTLRTMHLGPKSALLGAELVLFPGHDAPTVLRRVETAFKDAVPELQYVYLEDHE